MSFRLDRNNIFREVVVAGLKLVPTGGGMLSALTGAIWPVDGSVPPDQVEAYVKSMIGQILDEAKLATLRVAVDGLNDELVRYNQAGSQSERNSTFPWLMNETTYLKSQFVAEDDQPWKTLTYLVQFGTIRLTLLREGWLRYEQIYGQPDASPDTRHQNLKNEIQMFMGAVQTALAHSRTWREGCITVDDYFPFTGGLTASRTYRVSDTEDPGFPKLFSDTSNPDAQTDRDTCRRNHETNVFQVVNGWADGLQQLILPYGYWPYLDLTTPPTFEMWKYNWKNRLGDAYCDPDPNANNPWVSHNVPKYSWWANNSAFSGQISRIIIYFSNDWVNGFEIYYGGVSEGLHGNRNDNCHDITFADAEHIVQMGHRAGNCLHRL